MNGQDFDTKVRRPDEVERCIGAANLVRLVILVRLEGPPEARFVAGDPAGCRDVVAEVLGPQGPLAPGLSGCRVNYHRILRVLTNDHRGRVTVGDLRKKPSMPHGQVTRGRTPTFSKFTPK